MTPDPLVTVNGAFVMVQLPGMGRTEPLTMAMLSQLVRDAGVEIGLDVERLARAIWHVRAGTTPPPRADSANWAEQREAAARIAREYAAAREKP